MAALTLLSIRPRRPLDDAFIALLSEQAFRPFSRRAGETVRAMIQAPDAHTEIAERQGEPIGFFVVRLMRHERPFGPIAQPVIAHLDAIAVDGTYRGRGVGRGLLARAMQYAARRGALSMFLMTAAANHRARGVFERAGFDYVASVPRAYLSRQPAVVMMRNLPTRG